MQQNRQTSRVTINKKNINQIRRRHRTPKTRPHTIVPDSLVFIVIIIDTN